MDTVTLDDARALVERLYAALAAGDAEALEQVLAADFVGSAAAGMPIAAGGLAHGRSDMRDRVWWQIGRHYDAAPVPSEFHFLDDGRLYVAGTYVGNGRRSQEPLNAAYVHIISIADGRIIRLEQLTDTALWERALGAAGSLKTIDYRVVDGVARVTLNRPEVCNAIDLTVAEETFRVAQMIENDPAVRAVLIAGKGDAFTVGGDIDYFVASAQPGEYGALFARMTTPFHDAFRIFARINVPIVTAVQGCAAGGGLGYVFAADICIAASDARFVSAFAGIGLSGDGGGTWHLPRLIGPRRAMEMYLENKPMSAAQALDAGLVTEVVEPEVLLDHAFATATRLAQGPTRAYARMRQLLHQSWSNDYSQQLAAETSAVAATGDTRDAAGAIAAFLDKQRPTFEGH